MYWNITSAEWQMEIRLHDCAWHDYIAGQRGLSTDSFVFQVIKIYTDKLCKTPKNYPKELPKT